MILSDFPYTLEWEFSDSLIIGTFGDAPYIKNESSVSRIVAFGEFTYTEEGSLETANFSSWYEMGFSKGVMNDDTGLREDILSGRSNTYSGLSITDINDVSQLVFIDRFFDDSSQHEPYENHAFESDEPFSDTGLGKEGIISSEAGKYFYDQWYLSPWGNNLIAESVASVSSEDSTKNSANNITSVFNTHARGLVGDVLTGSAQFSHNSFDAKFYNLGEGRYGIQKKGESTIDEITGVTSLQFQDQALSLANDVAATFNQVKGMDDVSGVVFRLYNAAFARLPDAKGLENWINGNSTGGVTYAVSAQEFSSSQEFKNRYGANTTDTQYITTLYNNVLERSPDKAGLANYQNLLANGKTRGALLLDFSESPENRVLFTEVTGLS